MADLAQIRIVLVEPSHAGNIGAVARAMKTMGLDALHLVAPRRFPADEATRRAAGAEDVLAAARVHGDLQAALADCHLVVGSTARARSIEWPVMTPRQAVERVWNEPGPVALVFGRERCGLHNEEVDLCHYLVRIPANPDYPSLNLAAAVQILAYEMRVWHGGAQPPPDENSQACANAGQLGLFYRHLEETLRELEFVKTAHPPTKLMRKLVRLFNRARPSTEEINILRGILAAAQEKARRRS